MIKAMYLCNKQKCEGCNNSIWGECHDTTEPDFARDKYLVDLIDDINTAFEPRFKHTQEADYCLVEKDDFDIKDVLALKTVKRVDDVLDKIRAEIEHLTITEGGEDYTRKMAELYSLKIKILQIIDRYMKGE